MQRGSVDSLASLTFCTPLTPIRYDIPSLTINLLTPIQKRYKYVYVYKYKYNKIYQYKYKYINVNTIKYININIIWSM